MINEKWLLDRKTMEKSTVDNIFDYNLKKIDVIPTKLYFLKKKMTLR